MFVAAAALLFALVCPLAVTPMPIGKVKRLAEAVVPPVLPFLIVAFTIFHEELAAGAGSPAPTVDIPDLICVRTC